MFPENHRDFFSYLFFHLAEMLEITWFVWYVIIIWAAYKQLTNQKRCSDCPMLYLYMEVLWIWILKKPYALWEVPKDMPIPLLSYVLLSRTTVIKTLMKWFCWMFHTYHCSAWWQQATKVNIASYNFSYYQSA